MGQICTITCGLGHLSQTIGIKGRKPKECTLKTIRNVVTEYRAHQDEYCACWMAERFGGSAFPGLRFAELSFADRELGKPDPHTLYVGVGNAENHPEYGEFNEHRQYGRLQGTCAAVMMAQHLHVLGKPGVKDLLNEVLASDIEPKTFPTQLASLVKMMHRVKKGQGQLETYNWATTAFDAIAFRDADPKADLREFWKEYCMNVKVEGRERQTMDKLINTSFSRRNSLVTELSSIVYRMRPDIVYRWLQETFDVMVEDARLFQAAVKEVNSEGVIAFDIQTANGTEPAYFMISDNEQVGKAASSILTGKATICVVRSSKGLTQIFSDPFMKLPMSELAALLRMAEYREWTGKILPYERALGGGTIPECQQWHLPNPNMILNGSLTHPWIKRSRLDMGRIQDIAYHAFTASGRKIWINRYLHGDNGLQRSVTESIYLGSIFDREQGRKD